MSTPPAPKRLKSGHPDRNVGSILPLTGSKPTPTLMDIPVELRLPIWNLVIDSTIVGYGGEGSNKETRATAFAIFRVCRQIHDEIRDEIGTSWIGRVLFYFETLLDMLYTLSPLPSTIRSQIRRIRVYNHPFSLYWPDTLNGASFTNEETCALEEALQIIPDLQLDMLMVEGSAEAGFFLHDIRKLICFGNGWREIQCFSNNSVGRVNLNKTYVQEGMRRWKAGLLRRDGHESGSSISIYRTTESSACADPPYRVTWPRDSEICQLQTTPNGDLRDEAERDWDKGFMVVAKRGPAVDIAGSKEPDTTWEVQDVRRQGCGTTWEEITAKCWIEEFPYPPPEIRPGGIARIIECEFDLLDDPILGMAIRRCG